MAFFVPIPKAAPAPVSAANQASSSTTSASTRAAAGHSQAIPGIQMPVPAGHMEVGSNGPFDTQTTNSLIKKLAARSIF